MMGVKFLSSIALMMKITHLTAALLLSCLLMVAGCQTDQTILVPQEDARFQGEQAAVDQAVEMFDAIGGTSAWAKLRALYVKANHTQPDLAEPYLSEIWRAMDEFELRIVQRSEAFHRIARVNAAAGSVVYVDDGGRTRSLSSADILAWQFEHDHNVYVVLHRIAKNPGAFRVILQDEERLAFFEQGKLLAAFELDDRHRPYRFYQPTQAGDLSVSEFTEWGEHGGLVHSAGGGPVDGDFRYSTLEWTPSFRAFSESYVFDR